jgi:hypothetical protein
MSSNLIKDLTVEELRALIREEMRPLIHETVRQVLDEVIGDHDPDMDLAFKPEIANQLSEYLREKPKGQPAHEVMRELDLLDE